jgi:hypothetical protein
MRSRDHGIIDAAVDELEEIDEGINNLVMKLTIQIRKRGWCVLVALLWCSRC